MQVRCLAFLLVFSMFLSGCATLLIGGVGVLGGYAISRDTIAGESDAKPSKLFKVARDVVSIMGVIKSVDEDEKRFQADVYSSAVTVEVEEGADSNSRSRLIVKARRFYMPNIGLAQKIFVKVMHRLDYE